MIRLVITLTLLGFVSACQPQNTQISADEIASSMQGEPLLVGTTSGPATYLRLDGQASGFDFELVQAFANHIDRRLELKVYETLDHMLDDLATGKLDLVAAGMGYTDLRSKRFLFGPPLYFTDILLVYRTEDWRPRNLNDVNGKLMVAERSSHAELLNQLDHPQLQWQVSDQHDPDQLLTMVADGSLSYTLADSRMLQLNRRLNPQLRTAFVIKEQQAVGWMFAPNGSDLLISQVLDFWQTQSDHLPHLREKYFGHVKGFDYVDTRAFIRAIQQTLPKYQNWFEQYAGDIDWRKIAAISYQESHWRPLAKSPTGVRGMMMLTLPTAKQVGVTNRLDAEQSIRGGAAYINQLVERMPDSIPEPERLWFALAAYNIGFGHMEDARVLAEKRGLNPSAWADVKQVLPLLQQRKHYKHLKYGYARGNEALHYVENIRRYYDTLVYFHTHEQQQAQQSVDLSEPQAIPESANTAL
ncbi:membrane-bound lytic murein transglycosylase MltF [Paraferrimonas sedimenticola]|uniref:Membrane-bound lytic murein transglycosylase F n=1 Tax=Paraferrimonas sedimenticola TaxID=375674 RepID=A0AA37RRR1_9GAMM|nr:membrane-bound lytic murein transglycosylase MltF [Paraferrimonas sedimenticola]GLP95153.1 membrane-bound lytic murein transglycosylase F [Paraferrimonas sedimenticola]